MNEKTDRMENFSTTLVLRAHKEKVYESLTLSINEWWSEMFEGTAHEPGQTFTIRFGSQVFKTIMVEELMVGKKVAWSVVDALIDLPDLNEKKEWVNTRILWKISPAASGSVVELTHFGLNPEMECYHVCVSGWQSFLYSFEKFVTTGIGSPFKLTGAS